MAIQGGIYRGSFYEEKGFGNYVSIQHDDGTRAIYAHFESVNKNLKVGQRINEGDFLGIEGTTGNSTGIHLHLEIRKSPYTQNDRINVADYIGIENKLGDVVVINDEVWKHLRKLEAMKKVQDKAGLEDKTIAYLDKYEWNEDLFIKLANAME